MRRAAVPLLLALAALLATMCASPAQAAKRKVPFGFFGTVLPPEMSDPRTVPDATLDRQMALMARSGVESVRLTVGWDNLEPAQGMYSFAGLDRMVAAAARHRLAILPAVLGTPQWASEQPTNPVWSRYPPRDPQLYADFIRQLVLRYGPRGSFWAENPSIPRTPIRQWQVWNEQMAPFFWDKRPWAPSYTRLLKLAYRAIHRADRGAKVVAGSLVAIGDYPQWDGMRDLYRAGAKGFFDVIAVHPFTNADSVAQTISQTLGIVERVRDHMRRRGDRRKPIILTELTWPAAVGKLPRNRLLGFEVTPRGQAQRLTAIYSRLAQERRRRRITQAYWYTWATQYDARTPASDVPFRFTGLTRFRGGVFSRMPILGTYSRLARRYEGCRKTSDARRCAR